MLCFVECSRVVLFGDLNYRISLPEETTRLLVERKDWDTLLQNDQVSKFNYKFEMNFHVLKCRTRVFSL